MVTEPANGFNGLFIEMKTSTGVQSKEQIIIQAKLNQRGYLCVVAKSATEGFNIVEGYLNGRQSNPNG